MAEFSKRRRVLVKVGGETCKDVADRARLARDLQQVVASGAQLCVVHGAGPQITELGKRLGLSSVFRGGRRVTDAPMLQAAAMAMTGQVGADLLAACLAVGVRAVSTPSASAGLVVGRKRPPKPVPGEESLVDFGLVADVAEVDPALLQALWGADMVPLLSSLVCDVDGQLLNLNADTLVTALVQALEIDDVILVTGVPGVYRDLADPASHLPELTDEDLPRLISSGAVHGGMVAKLEEVGAILKKGAQRVALVGFQQDRGIASALAGGEGLRTMVRRSKV